jgi:formylglycine-generating enzyme required for sulfatase activity
MTDLWGALLAGQALTETAVLDKVSPRNQKKLDRIKRWLIRILEGNQLRALERVNAGNALAVLGDPRFDPKNWYLPADSDFGFVGIPAGPFTMGSDENRDKQASNYEMPQHSVNLGNFRIARFPVTVAQYQYFAQETNRELNEDWKQSNTLSNHPVVDVSWYNAVAYCEWLTRKVREKGWDGLVRLPTEAEWEKAARGTDGRVYPWGDRPDPEKANYYDTGIGSTSPVGCFTDGMSPYGLIDFAGNVSEWTSTIWGDAFSTADFEYPYVSDDGREDFSSHSHRTLRGGSWRYYARVCRVAHPNRREPDYLSDSIGFRLVFIPGQQ